MRRRSAGIRGDVRHPVRFSLGIGVAAVAFLAFALLWASTCGGSVADTVACGTAQRTLLALGAPMILAAGGIWAYVRAYQVWRRDGTPWSWLGAAVLLTIAMLLMLT